MKRVLAIVGGLALFGWTALGVFAWASVSGHFQLTVVEAGAVSSDAMRSLALADEVSALHQDLRALSTALGQNLTTLQDDIAQRESAQEAAVARQLAGLEQSVRELVPSASTAHESIVAMQQEIAALVASVRSGQVLAASAVEAAAPAPVPESATVQTAPQTELASAIDPQPASALALDPKPAPARRSFLAFQLPSDDVRFDERRAWTLLPALSRVGFDAKSTLHDFTGVTSKIEGELEVDLSHPDAQPRARLQVDAATLATGVDGRDENMRESLSVAQHKHLEFELTRFDATRIDAANRTAEGKACGKLRIRGVTREVVMPVKLSIDDARRLCVEGDMPLDLTRFEVPVPNKLGVIAMEKEVKVWISLRMRAAPRAVPGVER